MWKYGDFRFTRHDLEILTLGTKGAHSVTFSPDAKRILSVGRKVKLWDAEKGTEILTLKGHKSRVNSGAFSPDGKRIVSGSSDKTIKIWDPSTGQEAITLRGHTSAVTSVAFSPDGKRIVSGSRDKTVIVWDARTD